MRFVERRGFVKLIKKNVILVGIKKAGKTQAVSRIQRILELLLFERKLHEPASEYKF